MQSETPIQGDVSPRLFASRFDTSTLRIRDRIRTWREAATAVWEVTETSDEDFSAKVRAWHGGDLIFGRCRSTSQKTDRTESWIARDGLDYYMLQFYTHGQRRIETGGHEDIARIGDLVTLDMTCPVKTMSTSYESNDLVIPRNILEPLLTYPNSHGGRVHSGAHPLVRLLRVHLSALTDAAPELTSAQVHDLKDSTIALVAATLNGVVSAEFAPLVRASMVLPIRNYIDSHILDRTLSIESIAAYFGVSRATLYRTFKPYGGVHEFILRRRLNGCRKDLKDPNLKHVTINQIILKWGFASPQSFSRTFRQIYGLSPREYRQAVSQRGVHMPSMSSGVDSAWSTWIKNL